MNRRSILAGSIAATVAPAFAQTKTAPTFADLCAAYAQLQTMINLHNEAVGVPNERAEEYRYKRMQQVAAAVDLGLR
jgi:hypothetical protein